VVGAFPGERAKLTRDLRRRGALVGEYSTSGEAFRAAWDKLMRTNIAGKRPWSGSRR
jgi:hypothetical protein